MLLIIHPLTPSTPSLPPSLSLSSDVSSYQVLTKEGRLDVRSLVSSQQTVKREPRQEQGLGPGSGQGPGPGLGPGLGLGPGQGPGIGRWDYRGVPGPAEICDAEVFLGSPSLGKNTYTLFSCKYPL